MADRIVKESTFYVRYAETDAMGIVHHASYIVYFEDARTSYARQRGSDYASFERAGRFLTVTEVHARYIKPIVYGQQITVRCWIEDMKSRLMTFAYEVVDVETHELHATGQTKHIAITKDGRVTTFPDEWRAWNVEQPSP